jgi:cytochrome P450
MRAPPYASQADALFSAAAIANPHVLFAELRAKRPISRVAETGVHLVASWALIEEALGRESDFSANLTGVLMRGEDGKPMTIALPDSAGTRVIATADEPAHALHRAIVQPRLAARRAHALEAPLRAWTRSAIDDWLAQGGGDFVSVAELVPARVVAHLLGLPDGDVSRYRTWAMMGGDILAGDIDAERLMSLARETGKMVDYLGAHFDAAMSDTEEGVEAPLLHALARGAKRGEVDRDEAVGIATVMFGAAGESTAALIGSVVRYLAEAPTIAAELRRDAELIPRFVEEVVRLEPPFKFHYRAVRQPCELGGAELAVGDRLMLLWASANRDASHFEEPDTLRLDRKHPKDHLSFGRGSHFCVGAPFARLEARIVCEELLDRCQKISVARGTTPVHAKSIFVRRLERLVLDV